MNVSQVSLRFYIVEEDTLMVKVTVHLADGREQSLTTEVDTENITVFLDNEVQKAVGQC